MTIIPPEMFPKRGSGIKAEPIARAMQAVNDMAGNRFGDSITLPNGTATTRTPLQPDRSALVKISAGDLSQRGLHRWTEARVIRDAVEEMFEVEDDWDRARYHDDEGGYGLAYNASGYWVPPGTVVLATLRLTTAGERLWVFNASPSSLAVPGLLGAATLATPNLWDYAWAEAELVDADTWAAVEDGIEDVARNAMEYGNAATGQQGIGLTLPVAGADVVLLPVKEGLPLSFEPHGFVDDSESEPLVAFRWQFSAPNGITVACGNGGGA